MDIPISLDLHQFPEHSKLVADMLLGFANLELTMLDMVGQALGGDANTAAPVLYCLKGAEDRLNVANAILTPFIERIQLQGPYSQWLGAMRRCKTIRNQYAHCAWDVNKGVLGFGDLSEPLPGGKVRFRAIKLDLLQEQHRFFQYTRSIEMFLVAEMRFRRDRRRRHKWKLPKSLPVPNLNSAQGLRKPQ